MDMQIVSLVLAAMMLAPVGVRAQEAMQQTKPVLTLPAISVSEASMRDLRERVIAGGLVGAVEQVIVQPLIEGQPIEALEAEAGDYVDQGQVLARLSLTALELQRSQLKAGLASAKAAVAQAEAQVLEAVSAADEAARVATRTATLNERGQASAAANDQAQAGATAANARVTVARQMAEAARAQVELAEAQLANVELNLTRTNVVAPVAGEVLLRNAQIGAVASATGQPMFVLMKNGALELRAEIAEADLIGLQPGMGAWVRAVGMAEPLSGTVRLVEPGVNAATRLGTARITLDNTHILRSGMYAEAEIVVAERRALAVPVTAVGAAAEGATVMVVRDGIVHRAAVRTGIRDAGWIEIVSGLAEGEQVVTKAAAFVRDGDRVNPIAAPTQ